MWLKVNYDYKRDQDKTLSSDYTLFSDLKDSDEALGKATNYFTGFSGKGVVHVKTVEMGPYIEDDSDFVRASLEGKNFEFCNLRG